MPGEMTLRAIALSKRYGNVVALDGVSLEVGRGECVALIGESGSGKTTLLRCFNRLVDPDEGQMLVGRRRRRGTRSDRPAPADRLCPQDGGLLPHWRVGRNVELVPWLRGMPERTASGPPRAQTGRARPGVFTERWPRELSGGPAAAGGGRAGARRHPDVILLDEPFGALDAHHPRRPPGHLLAASAGSSASPPCW